MKRDQRQTETEIKTQKGRQGDWRLRARQREKEEWHDECEQSEMPVI